MQWISRFFLVAMLFLSPVNYALSADGALQPILMMDHVDVIKATERDGDELYFDIAVYQGNQPTQYLRIPAKPMNWPSGVMDKVKKIILWSQPLQSGQAITLIVSLLDSDGSVLNPDDLIGSMRVDLKNEKGSLQTRWSMPNHTESLGTKNMQKFELLGGGQYDVYLSLKK